MSKMRMVRRVLVLTFALAAVAMLLAPAATAQDNVDKVRQTQARLLAKRAAQVDAYRQLAEQVMGLRITSNTLVKDFVAENDEIATRVNAFLRGAKVVDVQYMEDDSAEVTVELALLTVQTEMVSIYKAHYKGDKYKINDFQQMTTTNRIDKITAVGSGAPRQIAVEEYTDEGRPVAGRRLSLPDSWRDVPPQARLMAKRAAQVDAYRNLAEQVNGLQIRSDTFVRDFVAESDNIRADMNTFLRGAKFIEVRYLDDLSVEVDVRIALASVVGELKREYEAHYKGDKYQIRDFEEMTAKVKIDYVTATGTGLPPEKYLTGRTTTTTVVSAPDQPSWVRDTIKATGSGVSPDDVDSAAQGRLLALRAAKVDAMRNLSEQIYGLRIDSDTTVRDFVATNDTIRTEVNTYLVGARTVSEDYVEDTGEATVVVEIPLETLWKVVIKYRR